MWLLLFEWRISAHYIQEIEMKKEDLQMLLFPSIFSASGKGVFTKCLFSFLAIFLAVLDFITFFRFFCACFKIENLL